MKYIVVLDNSLQRYGRLTFSEVQGRSLVVNMRTFLLMSCN